MIKIYRTRATPILMYGNVSQIKRRAKLKQEMRFIRTTKGRKRLDMI